MASSGEVWPAHRSLSRARDIERTLRRERISATGSVWRRSRSAGTLAFFWVVRNVLQSMATARIRVDVRRRSSRIAAFCVRSRLLRERSNAVKTLQNCLFFWSVESSNQTQSSKARERSICQKAWMSYSKTSCSMALWVRSRRRDAHATVVFCLLINCNNQCTASVRDLRNERGRICGRGNSLKNDLRLLQFELCGVDTGSLL